MVNKLQKRDPEILGARTPHPGNIATCYKQLKQIQGTLERRRPKLTDREISVAAQKFRELCQYVAARLCQQKKDENEACKRFLDMLYLWKVSPGLEPGLQGKKEGVKKYFEKIDSEKTDFTWKDACPREVTPHDLLECFKSVANLIVNEEERSLNASQHQLFQRSWVRNGMNQTSRREMKSMSHLSSWWPRCSRGNGPSTLLHTNAKDASSCLNTPVGQLLTFRYPDYEADAPRLSELTFPKALSIGSVRSFVLDNDGLGSLQGSSHLGIPQKHPVMDSIKTSFIASERHTNSASSSVRSGSQSSTPTDPFAKCSSNAAKSIAPSGTSIERRRWQRKARFRETQPLYAKGLPIHVKYRG